MCRNGVDTRLFAQVPEPDGVVIPSSGYVVAIGTEVHGQHTLEVAIQEHEAATRAEVPHTATGVQSTGRRGQL